MRTRPITRPELPEISDLNDVEALRKRVEAMQGKIWTGWEIDCRTERGDIRKSVLLRNCEGTHASSIAISLNMAELLVNREIARLFGIDLEDKIII